MTSQIRLDPLQQTLYNLDYHKPQNSRTMDFMGEIRNAAKELVKTISLNTMYCRETQMAYTKIEEATMDAIAGLARNEEASLADLDARGLF